MPLRTVPNLQASCALGSMNPMPLGSLPLNLEIASTTMWEHAERRNWQKGATPSHILDSGITGVAPRTPWKEFDTGTFEIVKSNTESRMHRVCLTNQDGSRNSMWISEHDEQFAIGRQLAAGQINQWRLLKEQGRYTEREQDMYQWWIFTSALRMPLQKQLFFTIWDYLLNQPETDKWKIENPYNAAELIEV